MRRRRPARRTPGPQPRGRQPPGRQPPGPQPRGRQPPGRQPRPRSPQRVLEALEDADLAGSEAGLAGCRGERLERLALLPRELRGNPDVHDDVEVAARAGPAQMRRPATAQPDLRAGLRPGLDLHVLLAVRGRHADGRPQRRLGDRQREIVEELGALALERRVRRDVDRHVEAAGRAAPRADLALRGEADLVAVVDARGHADAEPLRALTAAVAAARLAGRLDDFALAAASGARHDVDHLAQHRLAHVADLAAALALGAGDRRRAGLRAGSRAGVAAIEDRELDLLLGAPDRLLEGDPQVVPEVGADDRAPAPGAPAPGGRPAEERVEEVRESAAALLRPVEARGPVDPGRPEHVVRLAALRVGQDLVRLVDLLEALVGPGVAVDVRVPLLGQLAEGALDLRIARGAGYAEDRVVVAFGRHSLASLREGRREAPRGRSARPGRRTRAARMRRAGPDDRDTPGSVARLVLDDERRRDLRGLRGGTGRGGAVAARPASGSPRRAPRRRSRRC